MIESIFGNPAHITVGRQSGFSLIEAMLAFLVVGFGLIGLAGLQSDFFNHAGSTRIQTAALHYAQQKIEEIRSFATQSDYLNAVSTQNGSVDNCDPQTVSSACKGVNASLQRTTSINNCAGGLPCRLVQVSVAWTDTDGHNQNLTLNSYITGLEPVKAGVFLAQ